MICDTRKETLIDLLAGELSEEEAVVVEQHLAECRACRAEMNALALMTHPFLSEESWQPDAAMADRILLRAQTDGWVASPMPTPASSVRAAGPAEEAGEGSGDEARTPLAQPPVSTRAQTGVRSFSTARPSWLALLSWFTRPLPSYATVGLVLLALAAGLVLGGGAGRFRGRGVPIEAGGSDQPSLSSPPTERSADRTSERLAGRQADDDSSWQATAPARGGRTSTGAHNTSRPIAFVAVYTDAMRLTTPGVRDSF
jgi:anti-sigma factor RsiW